jgi:hypothetical protein
VLELRPGLDPADSVHTSNGITGIIERTPWLWAIQTRTDAGWATTMLPGTERRQVVGRRGSPEPRDVRVIAVSRVGNVGPAARVGQLR